MPFKPGNNANPQGRPRGSKDKINTAIRDKFRSLIDDNLDQLRDDLRELKARERIDAIIRLSNFVLPKLQSIQIYDMPEITELLMMTPDERKQELARIKQQLKDESKR